MVFCDVMDINYYGMVVMFELFVGLMMVVCYGMLVGVVSVVGVCGLFGFGVYSVLKLVVIKYFEVLCVELCLVGVGVVMIVFGYICMLMIVYNLYWMLFLMDVDCFVVWVV